jgi:hypothetical protein
LSYRVNKSDPQHWTYDLGREVRLTEIEGVRLPAGVTTIELSRQGFPHDSQRVEVETSSRSRFGRHHYGWFHSESVAAICHLDHTCRFVRMPVDQPEGRTKDPGTPIGIEFRGYPMVASAGGIGYGGWQATSQRQRVIDLDGDGREELLVATDQHELVALSADGELLWSRQIDVPIVDFYVTDLDGDGRREILLARWNKNLTILDHQGHPQVSVDVGLPRKAVGTGPYYVAALNLGGGQKIPAVGTWNVMLTPKPGSDPGISDNWMYAIDDSWPKDSGVRENGDWNDNGRPDILMHGWQGPIVVSELQTSAGGDPQLHYIAKHQSIPGRYFYCDRFQLAEHAGSRTILCAGQQGLAAIKLAPDDNGGIEFTEVFRLPVSPISCYDIADVNDDGFADIVLGNSYGYILVIDNMGHVLAHKRHGDGVYHVQVVHGDDGKIVISAAVDGHLLFCDTELTELARTNVGRVTALRRLPLEGVEALVVFGAQRWWATRLRDALTRRVDAKVR